MTTSSPTPAAIEADALRETLISLIADRLSGTYHCNRVSARPEKRRPGRIPPA